MTSIFHNIVLFYLLGANIQVLSEGAAVTAKRDEFLDNYANRTVNPCSNLCEYVHGTAKHNIENVAPLSDLAEQALIKQIVDVFEAPLKTSDESNQFTILRSLYSECKNTSKSEFATSPIVQDLFETCGGRKAFKSPEVANQNLIDILIGLWRNYGLQPLFTLVKFNDTLSIWPTVTIDMLADKAASILEYFIGDKDLSTKLGMEFEKIQEDIVAIAKKPYYTSGTKDLKSLSVEYDSIDYYKYVKNLLNGEFYKDDDKSFGRYLNISVRENVIAQYDAVLKKYDTRSMLAYIFVMSTSLLELNLFVFDHDNDMQENSPATNYYDGKECVQLLTKVKLLYYAAYDSFSSENSEKIVYYFKKFLDTVKESGSEIIKEKQDKDSDGFFVSLRKKILNLSYNFGLPKALNKSYDLPRFLKAANILQHDDFFTKLTKLCRVQKAYEYQYFAQYSYDQEFHNLISKSPISNDLISYNFRKNVLDISKLIYGPVYFDRTRPHYLQLSLLDIASQISFAVLREIDNLQISYAYHKMQQLVPCILEENTIIKMRDRFVDGLSLQIAEKLYEKYAKDKDETEDFFITYAVTQCQRSLSHDDILLKILKYSQRFSETFGCELKKYSC